MPNLMQVTPIPGQMVGNLQVVTDGRQRYYRLPNGIILDPQSGAQIGNDAATQNMAVGSGTTMNTPGSSPDRVGPNTSVGPSRSQPPFDVYGAWAAGSQPQSQQSQPFNYGDSLPGRSAAIVDAGQNAGAGQGVGQTPQDNGGGQIPYGARNADSTLYWDGASWMPTGSPSNPNYTGGYAGAPSSAPVTQLPAPYGFNFPQWQGAYPRSWFGGGAQGWGGSGWASPGYGNPYGQYGGGLDPKPYYGGVASQWQGYPSSWFGGTTQRGWEGSPQYSQDPNNPDVLTLQGFGFGDQTQYGGAGGQQAYQSQNPNVPLPWQVNPSVWDSLSPTGQGLAIGAAKSSGWDPNDYRWMMDQARPRNYSPDRTVQNSWNAPSSGFQGSF